MHDFKGLFWTGGAYGREAGFFQAQSELLDEVGFVIEDADGKACAMQCCYGFFESRHEGVIGTACSILCGRLFARVANCRIARMAWIVASTVSEDDG